MLYEIEALKKLSVQLGSLIAEVKLRLKHSDEGTLIIRHSNGRVKLYRYNGDNRYLGKKDVELKKQLLQKRYDTLHLDTLKKQKASVDECISKLVGFDGNPPEELFLESLPKEVRSLAEVGPATDEDYVNNWMKSKECFFPVNLDSRLYTSRGEHVRSKSEVLIANRLASFNVPYRYEALLVIGKVAYHPDFTMLNRRTRQEFIWEHLGMLDSESYLKDSIDKLDDFSKAGIIIGKNLIVTFEGSKSPLSTKYIDRLIKEFLL